LVGRARQVLKYLLVLLVVPVIRRLVALAATLMAAAYLVTIPARLWVLHVDPRPGECHIIVLNAMSSGLLVGVLLGRYLRRGHGR